MSGKEGFWSLSARVGPRARERVSRSKSVKKVSPAWPCILTVVVLPLSTQGVNY